MRKKLTATWVCAYVEDHTPCPQGYLQWFAWAAKMARTHKQVRCGGCGRFKVWVPRKGGGR